MVKHQSPDIFINSPLYNKKERLQPYALLSESGTSIRSSLNPKLKAGQESQVQNCDLNSFKIAETLLSKNIPHVFNIKRDLIPLHPLCKPDVKHQLPNGRISPDLVTKLLIRQDPEETTMSKSHFGSIPNGYCQDETSSTNQHQDTKGCRGRSKNHSSTLKNDIILDPTGQYTYYWSFFVVGAFLYNLWVIVYRYAFHEIGPYNRTKWFVLDYSADLIYLADIIVGFRISYFRDGVLQTDRERIRQRYINSTTFYIDCLAILPIDFLYLSLGYNSLFRILRLVKIFKFLSFIDRTECSTNYPTAFRTAVLLHYLLLAFHWNSCVVYSIARAFDLNLFIGKPSTLFPFQANSSNPYGTPFDGNSHTIIPYLRALYWSALALTTFGDMPRPRSNGDYILCITQILLGLVLFATLMGQVSSLILTVRTQEKEYQKQVDAIKTYMRKRDVPEKFQKKVRKWLNYMRLIKNCPQEDKVISTLPTKLQAEMAIYVHLDTLKRVEIFQNTEAGFLRQLVLKLKPVLFSPQDLVCVKGEVGKEMYIVNTGVLHILGGEDDKSVVLVLGAGSYFGEISILNMGPEGNHRTASVISVGYSELFSLSQDDLWDVLKSYPKARARLENIAAHRLTLASPNLTKNKNPEFGNHDFSQSAINHDVLHQPNLNPHFANPCYNFTKLSIPSLSSASNPYKYKKRGLLQGEVSSTIDPSPSTVMSTDESRNVSSLSTEEGLKAKFPITPPIVINDENDRIVVDHLNTTFILTPWRRHSFSPNIPFHGANILTNSYIERQNESKLAKELSLVFKQDKKIMKLNKSISYPYLGGIKQYSVQFEKFQELINNHKEHKKYTHLKNIVKDESLLSAATFNSFSINSDVTSNIASLHVSKKLGKQHWNKNDLPNEWAAMGHRQPYVPLIYNKTMLLDKQTKEGPNNRRLYDITRAVKNSEINNLQDRIKALEKENLLLSHKLLSKPIK